MLATVAIYLQPCGLDKPGRYIVSNVWRTPLSLMRWKSESGKRRLKKTAQNQKAENFRKYTTNERNRRETSDLVLTKGLWCWVGFRGEEMEGKPESAGEES